MEKMNLLVMDFGGTSVKYAVVNEPVSYTHLRAHET